MSMRFQHLNSGEIETTEHFFSQHLLNARVNGDMESNKDFDQIFDEGRSEEWLDGHWTEIKKNHLHYEEDVNQYLTLTLAEWVNPRLLELMNECLVGIHSDVGQKAVEERQLSKRYHLYKINADFLLFQLGLFNPDTQILGDAFFDKGEAYYFSAATQLKGMEGGRSALSDVLEKLSLHFGRYVEILRQMKHQDENYLSFHFQLSHAEMERLNRELTREVQNRKNPGTSPEEEGLPGPSS